MDDVGVLDTSLCPTFELFYDFSEQSSCTLPFYTYLCVSVRDFLQATNFR